MRIAPLESRPILAGLLAAVVLAIAPQLVLAPSASASVSEKIILRCTHQESLSGFTQRAYREALKELSATTEEYSSCSSRIREAQLAAANSGTHGGGSGGGGQGAATPTAISATPAEQRAITHAEHGVGPVKLNGQLIHPGVVHVNVASALSSLPTPLLVTMTFLLVCLLLVLGGTLHKRVRARHAH